MPSAAEPDELVKLFNELQSAKSTKSKSDLLSRAKHYILNRMSEEELRDYFVAHGSLSNRKFEDLFDLDIWTKSLEESNAIVEFTEPYEIIEKILGLFKSVDELLDASFFHKVVFLIEQKKDENVKHVFMKRLTQLVPGEIKNEKNLKTLLILIAKQIPLLSCNYSKLLTEFLIKLSTSQLNSLITNDLVNELNTIFELNSVLSFRILELIIKLACASATNLSAIAEAKLSLSRKIDLYLRAEQPGGRASDVLSKLNCIELVTCLVESEHGFAYMELSGHLNALLASLVQPDVQDPFAPLLVPTLVKLFAMITKKRPKVVHEKYPGYFRFLFGIALDDNWTKNQESVNLGIETFAYLLEENSLKMFLHATYRPQLDALLRQLVSIVRTCINDKIRSNALSSLAEAIAVEPSLLEPSQDRRGSEHVESLELQALTQTLYQTATGGDHESLFQVCLANAKQPFIEKRLSAQLYFKALAQTEWGVHKLFEPNRFNSEEAFVTGYLLNRSFELEKQGLESKYELIRLLVANMEANADLIRLVGDENFEKMKLYVQEGPFFARGESRVAFESN